jgi:putative tryptophan/tyrosine transport system substrate-binding protein
MRDHGYLEGQDFVLDVRYVGTRADEVDRLIGELLPLRPSVIVTVGSQGAWAARKVTSTIPIVMAVVADPVGQGLVTSLAQPGGNLTGNAILSEVVSSKRLELLHEALPRARRIGVLENTSNPAYAFPPSTKLDVSVPTPCWSPRTACSISRGPRSSNR